MASEMKITEEQVKRALGAVIDPELGVDIVKLGLVYGISVRTQNSKPLVKILMTLTTPGCPLAGVFDPLVREALRVIPGLEVEEEVTIELTFDPPWTLEMVDPETREELGFG